MKNRVNTEQALKRKKLKLKKYRFKDAGSQIHNIGLCRQGIEEETGQNESKSHRKFRCIVSILLLVLTIKYITLLFYYKNHEENEIDEKMFLWFGDFLFSQPNIRKHFILVLLVLTLGKLMTQLLYHRLWKSKRMRCIPSMKLFQVFAGLKSSKELGLGWQDVLKLMKRLVHYKI